MNLNDFIKNTLVDINNGVRSANEEIVNSGSKKGFEIRIGDEADAIVFDIALTINDEFKTSGSGVINVFAAKLNGEAKFTGGQENLTRVSFKIYPDLLI